MPFKKGMIPVNKGKKKPDLVRAIVYAKTCPFCKKQIATKRKNQIYCNLACYAKSERLKELSKNSTLIKNNPMNKYHLGFKHSEATKERIRNNPDRHTFFIGGPNPGINKSKETILKIKEKRLFQKILKKDTKPEVIVQKLLSSMGIEYIKHKPITNIIHKYQCDIFINPNIIIECDGDYFHNYPIGREIDKMRTEELKERGYSILRFWEHEILNNLDYCKDKIREIIK